MQDDPHLNKIKPIQQNSFVIRMKQIDTDNNSMKESDQRVKNFMYKYELPIVSSKKIQLSRQNLNKNQHENNSSEQVYQDRKSSLSAPSLIKNQKRKFGSNVYVQTPEKKESYREANIIINQNGNTHNSTSNQITNQSMNQLNYNKSRQNIHFNNFNNNQTIKIQNRQRTFQQNNSQYLQNLNSKISIQKAQYQRLLHQIRSPSVQRREGQVFYYPVNNAMRNNQNISQLNSGMNSQQFFPVKQNIYSTFVSPQKNQSQFVSRRVEAGQVGFNIYSQSNIYNENANRVKSQQSNIHFNSPQKPFNYQSSRIQIPSLQKIIQQQTVLKQRQIITHRQYQRVPYYDKIVQYIPQVIYVPQQKVIKKQYVVENIVDNVPVMEQYSDGYDIIPRQVIKNHLEYVLVEDRIVHLPKDMVQENYTTIKRRNFNNMVGEQRQTSQNRNYIISNNTNNPPVQNSSTQPFREISSRNTQILQRNHININELQRHKSPQNIYLQRNYENPNSPILMTRQLPVQQSINNQINYGQNRVIFNQPMIVNRPNYHLNNQPVYSQNLSRPAPQIIYQSIDRIPTRTRTLNKTDNRSLTKSKAKYKRTYHVTSYQPYEQQQQQKSALNNIYYNNKRQADDNKNPQTSQQQQIQGRIHNNSLIRIRQEVVDKGQILLRGVCLRFRGWGDFCVKEEEEIMFVIFYGEMNVIYKLVKLYIQKNCIVNLFKFIIKI